MTGITNDTITTAKEIIAEGCGCDRLCGELVGPDVYCGCLEDAKKVLALAIRATPDLYDAATELDRFALVIEYSVRTVESPVVYEQVVAALKANRAAIKEPISRAATMPSDETIEACAKCVPTTWLDSLLSGPEAAYKPGGDGIERLLQGIAARIRALKGAPNSPGNDGVWRPIGTAPLDNTCVLVSVPSMQEGAAPIVGEAHFDPNAYGGTWWWAGQSQGDYHASPIHETNNAPTHWQPLPAGALSSG